MMIDNPKFAPARPDLTFLRRRVRPRVQEEPKPPAPAAKAAPSAPPAAARPASPSARPASPSARPAPPAATGPRIDYTRQGRDPAPAAATPQPPQADSPTGRVDYTHHGGGGSLDLSEPSAPAPAPAPNAAPSPASNSLDLSDPPAAAPRRSTPAPAAAPAAPSAWQRRHVVRVGGRSQLIMNVQEATATLTRVQSGIGALHVEAVCSPEIGDLRLGAAYQMRSGGSGIVQLAGGNRFAPSSRRPVITASHEEYERLGIDLRQTADLERVAVYAFSESRRELTWGGTLVVSLFGGARLEVPLETLYAGRIAMLMTLVNMDGELVVRAELETIAGDVREATRAYGFDRITWRDEKTPVD